MLRKALVVVSAMVLLAAGASIFFLTRQAERVPTCVAHIPGEASYTFTPEQAANAVTIAAVGMKLELPAHATTVALATALQESKLLNLDGGDRDSIGLFQQRPSQGWGTPVQLHDPVYAAGEFYRKLAELPDWAAMPITEAAQAVQRSAAPEAYAQWEPQARALAAALSGQFPAAFTCRAVAVGAPKSDIVALANAQLGTATLSGPQPAERGWAISSWLIGHATELGVDEVHFAGQSWTAASGAWAVDPAAGQDLSLHQVGV